MKTSDIPWRYGGETNHLRVLRSLLPVARKAVDDIADGASGGACVEFAQHGDENFSALELEIRATPGSRSKPLRIRILCDHDAIGRTHLPTEDDPCGEISDGRLVIRILEAVCGAETVEIEPEVVDRDVLTLRVNTMGVSVAGLIALTVENTPLGHAGLHLVPDDDAHAHDDPVASDPAYLREPGRIDVGIRDSRFDTYVRIAPVTRIHAVRALDAVGILRLSSEIESRRKA